MSILKLSCFDIFTGKEEDVADSPKPSAKKAKLEISSDIKKLIKEDEANKKQWEVVLDEAKSGKVCTSKYFFAS